MFLQAIKYDSRFMGRTKMRQTRAANERIVVSGAVDARSGMAGMPRAVTFSSDAEAYFGCSDAAEQVYE